MSLVIDLGPSVEADKVWLTWPRMNDDEFFEFCQRNRELRIERTESGEIIIMPPAGGESGSRNAEITRQFGNWVVQDGTGTAFDSSTGFKLPNGATRSPDASWIRNSRWQSLPEAERDKFAPICPDFVVELMSPSDTLSDTQAKMDEYIANGSALGWLIDRRKRQVHIYRPGVPVDILDDPAEVSGDPELPGFVLKMQRIF